MQRVVQMEDSSCSNNNMEHQGSVFEELISKNLMSLMEELMSMLTNEKEFQRERFASLLAYMIMATGELEEKKLSTFTKYSRRIRQTVEFDSNNQIVRFEYHLKNPTELKETLDKAFKPVVFEIKSKKKVVSMLELAAKLDKRGSDSAGGTVASEVSKLVREEEIWLLLVNVKNTIQEKVRKSSLRAELTYILTASFFNCCRHSDLRNADPATFELVPNKYVGHVVRVLVCETKTRKPRFIYFFPVNTAADPLVALHDLFSSTFPSKKSRTSERKQEQEWQMLRDASINNYDRFVGKHATESVFAIKHGPKSHLGRHLMSSYLAYTHHGEWVSPYGNWSAGKGTIESSVARAKYAHVQAEIPSDLFAFLSQYYQESKSGDFELNDTSKDPTKLVRHSASQLEINRTYGPWSRLVNKDVLGFVHSYAMAKRYEGK